MEEWTLQVECCVSSGECYVTFPEEMLSLLDWKEGTVLVWTIHSDNTVTVRSKDTGK